MSLFRKVTCLSYSLKIVFLFLLFIYFSEFLAAAANFSSSTAAGKDRVLYTMLKYLPRSGFDVLLNMHTISWCLHFFHFIWKSSSIILIHKMEKVLTNQFSSGQSLSPLPFRRYLNAPFYFIYNIFWSLIPFLSPSERFYPSLSTLIQQIQVWLSDNLYHSLLAPPGIQIFSTSLFLLVFVSLKLAENFARLRSYRCLILCFHLQFL